MKRNSLKKVKKILKKKFINQMLKSSLMLYLTFIIAFGLLLFYLSKKDYYSSIMLISVALLVNCFSKNIILTLGSAIIVSLIIRMKISVYEEFFDKPPSIKKINQKVKGVEKNAEAYKKQVIQYNKDQGNKKCYEFKELNKEWRHNENITSKKICKANSKKPEHFCWEINSDKCPST